MRDLMDSSFDSFGLARPILRAIESRGYTTPTRIQVDSIPLILNGNDVLGCAQTGTGKRYTRQRHLHDELNTGINGDDCRRLLCQFVCRTHQRPWQRLSFSN